MHSLINFKLQLFHDDDKFEALLINSKRTNVPTGKFTEFERVRQVVPGTFLKSRIR